VDEKSNATQSEPVKAEQPAEVQKVTDQEEEKACYEAML
jgi:hypothetical protein